MQESSQPCLERPTNPTPPFSPSAPIPLENSSSSYMYALAGASTPDLAYSVGSLFSNMSNSPPSSINLVTPSSSPPSAFCEKKLAEIDQSERFKAKEDSLRFKGGFMGYQGATEAILSMEGLDDLPQPQSFGSGEAVEDVAHSSPGSSMELVRYQPPIGTVAMDETIRIPTVPPRSATTPMSQYPLLPTLPSPLLSTLLSRIASPTAPISSWDRLGRKNETSSSNDSRSGTGYRLPKRKKLQLPIFLPYEIVKSLYDSVDFGVLPPSRFQQGSSSSATSIALAAPRSAGTVSPPISPPRTSTAAGPKSCPSSPKLRNQSLPRVLDGIGYDSSGSLLFSSLGLCSRLSSLSSFSLEDSLGVAAQAGQQTQTFGHGIVDEWERRRASQLGATRADSRSPSRLRLPLRREDIDPGL